MGWYLTDFFAVVGLVWHGDKEIERGLGDVIEQVGGKMLGIGEEEGVVWKRREDLGGDLE